MSTPHEKTFPEARSCYVRQGGAHATKTDRGVTNHNLIVRVDWSHERVMHTLRFGPLQTLKIGLYVVDLKGLLHHVAP